MAKADYFDEVKMRGGYGAASVVSCSGKSVITGRRLLWYPGYGGTCVSYKAPHLI